MPTSFRHLRCITEFGLFGPSWRPSWELYEPFWMPLGNLLGRLGPSWAVLIAFSANLEANQ
eukprot:8651404-Pyramimonas_sp.AAC.1